MVQVASSLEKLISSSSCSKHEAIIVVSQTRSQSLLICSSKAMKDWGEMMSRWRGRLGRAKEK